jgi:hypothetical protein
MMDRGWRRLSSGEAELPFTVAQASAQIQALRIGILLVALLEGAEMFPQEGAEWHVILDTVADRIGKVSLLKDDATIPDEVQGIALLALSADRREALVLVPFSAQELRNAKPSSPAYIGESVADEYVQVVFGTDGEVALEDAFAVSRVLALGL